MDVMGFILIWAVLIWITVLLFLYSSEISRRMAKITKYAFAFKHIKRLKHCKNDAADIKVGDIMIEFLFPESHVQVGTTEMEITRKQSLEILDLIEEFVQKNNEKAKYISMHEQCTDDLGEEIEELRVKIYSVL